MTRKIVGLYELITGVFGVILILASFLTKGKAAGFESVFLQLILGVILYAFLAYAGYGLLNGLRNAKRYSLALQAFQIPLLFMPAYIYKFSAAAFLAVGIKNGQFNYVGSVRPIDYAISMNPTNDVVYMVYIIPIIILLALIKSK